MRWIVVVLGLVCAAAAAAEPLIDRGTYRIELERTTRAHVVFANGDDMSVEWNGRILQVFGVNVERHRAVLPPSVRDERFAAAILLARDLAIEVELGPFDRTTPRLRAIPLDTKPPLVLLHWGTQWYLDRIGLVTNATPDANVHMCLLGQRCSLAIEGPDGRGLAIFEWQTLVQRPQVVNQPRRAWKEIVPGRIQRARADLIDCERALVAFDLRAARFHLSEADDAIDDLVSSLPMSHPLAIHFEILRDDLRAVRSQDTLTADNVAALRIALSKLHASVSP